MCEKTLRDDVSNKTVRDMTGVEKIEEFMRARLRWFGKAKRMEDKRILVEKNFVVDT